MQLTPLYIKIEQHPLVSNTSIYLKDIATIYCSNSTIEKDVKNMLLQSIKIKEHQKKTYSIMYIIDMISKKHPNVEIINLGETDFILEYNPPSTPSIIFEYLKAFIISLIVFFGSGFTIMTFNADVNVARLFDKINKLLLGTKDGHNIIEICYSIGIGLGIILFFNHFSRKKLEKELTPIQVEMRNYEQQINTAFIKDSEREGKTKDI